MERLTSPNINVDPDTDRFLHAAIGGKEIDWKQCRDSTLNVLINGPTSNGFGKDIFRKMVRDLYGRLKAYEDTGLTPEEIKAPFTEDAMINLAAQALGVEPSRLRKLAKVPAADVAEVVHGEWLRADDDWNSLTTIQCSLCSEEWCFETDDDVSLLNYKYCPNCGARMDGGCENA